MADGPGGTEVGRISIRVVPDTSNFRRDLQRQLDVIEKELKASIDVDVNLDTLKARGDMAVLMARLKAVGARGVSVDVDVDRKGKVSEFLSKLTSGASGASNSLPGLSHGLLITAAVAAFAAPALALISGVLVSLPALIAAVLIPIGALALGMDGLKKAAAVLAEPLKHLREVMSAAVESQFTPVFEKLKVIFPALEKSLPGVTKGIADLAQGFVNAVTSAAGMDMIENLIKRVGDLFTQIGPSVEKVTTGLLNLASSVADHFPGLGKFIDQFADRFTNWVSKITKKNWFGDSPLDRAIGSFRDSLQGIFDLIAQLGSSGFDLLSDPEMGKNIKEFFDALTAFAKNALPSLSSFFKDITGFLKEAGDLLNNPAVKTLLEGNTTPKDDPNRPKLRGETSFFPGFNKNDDGTDAFLVQVFDKFKAFEEKISSFFLTLWFNIKQGASTAFNAIPDIASAAFDFVLGVISQKINQIKGFFSGLGNDIFVGIPEKAGQVWDSVVAVVQQKIAEIVAAVQALPGKVAAFLNNPGLLVSAGQALMGGLLSGIKAGLQKVLDFASGIAAKIASVKGPISVDKTVLTPNGQALMQGLQDGIEGGFQGVLDRARQLAGEISDAIASGGPINANFKDQLKKQMDEIGIQSDELKVKLNQTTDKDQRDAIKDQRTQLQTIRDQLKLQSDQLGFSQKYSDQMSQVDKTYADISQRLQDVPTNFAKSVGGQFMSDLGISGQGAIPQGLQAGLEWSKQFASQFTVNVNNVDDAIAFKNNQLAKQSLQFVGRG